MESLTTAASIKPTTVEKLDKLQEYYGILYKSKGEVVSPKTADKLLALLLCVASERTEDNTLRRKLTPVAKRSVELFYYFLCEDKGFQDAVERREAGELSYLLKIQLHLQDEDPKHVELAKKLISTLTTNYPKFASWFLPVEGSQSFDITRLKDETHLAPEGAYYDTEFRLVAALFKTDFEKGLTDDEVHSRTQHYGTNRLPEPPKKSPLKMLFEQLKDFMVITLLVVSVLSLALQDWIEAVILLLVVITNVTIGFIQELKAERALQALKMLTIPHAKVIRNGLQEEIEAFGLVPGDIVVLEEGDSIPADLRMFEAINLDIIESVLTGESVPVTKTVDAIRKPNLTIGDRVNMAFMGTTVSKGRGKGIVVRTGKSTEVGAISKALVKPSNKKTLLQARLEKLGKILVLISIILCAVVVGIGFLRTYFKRKEEDTTISGHDVEVMIKVGISLAVSVIPEGLVAVTTVTMALGVQRMARRSVVVRKMPAVETIGSLTTICSDKTGTLTEGKMKLEQIWTFINKYNVSGTGIVPTGVFSVGSTELNPKEIPDDLRKTLMTCSLCNNSSIQYIEESKQWESVGDPTEVALLVASQKVGLQKSYWESHGHKFINEIAFDSDRKRMIVVYSLPEGGAIALVKGAPEMVLEVCDKAHSKKGVSKLSSKRLSKIDKANASMGSNGLRVLALAYRVFTAEEFKEIKEISEMEKSLVFLSLVGLIDPPRKEVRAAIDDCKNAGIRVCMITGDHPRTAFAIGCKLGIIPEDQHEAVVTGAQLDAMGKGDLSALDPFPSVFARVSPAHKLKIINALQLRGEVCAMTGDGVNDAPAIRNADVGIAMGKTATDLTKDAAAIILLDDNFTSIVHAVREGRRTYDNIQKFVLYLLACNSAEIYVMLFAVIVGLPIPFTPMMILWANLIADIPPAISLGIDNESPDILTRKPRDPKKGIFTPKSAMVLLYNGFSMAVITLALFAIAIHVEDYEIDDDNPEVAGPARALAFIGLTTMQLVHAFHARSIRISFFRRDFFSNRQLVYAFLISLALLVAGCYIPGIQEILNQWPLSGWDWAKILICVVIHAIFMEAFKFFYRWRANIKAKTKTEHLFYNDL